MKITPKQTNNSPNRSTTETTQSNWENQSAQSGNSSKTAVTQRAFISGVNDSPRMLAQRRQIENYTGTGQPSAASAHPASRINQQQPIQRSENPDNEKQDILQGKFASEPAAQLERKTGPQPNNTGLPDTLKNGIESLSGISMDNVKVHYNSPQPARLNALAYAQGSDIHVAPGQERHLPHEAWHVVQQAQGRVKPTMQMKDGVPVNGDHSLEHEADAMGARAMQLNSTPGQPMRDTGAPSLAQIPPALHVGAHSTGPLQRMIGFEFEIGGIKTEHNTGNENWVAHHKGDVISHEPGYNITADISHNDSQLEFVTDQFDETTDDGLEQIGRIANYIKGDIKAIVDEAKLQNGVVLASDVQRLNGGNRDRFEPLGSNYLNLAGQLQMTGGVSVKALAGIVSGTAMPDRGQGLPGTQYQDYAVNYKDMAPNGELQQPIFHAARDAVNGFVGQVEPKRGGIPGRTRGALAAVVTLMAQVPLNMRGALPVAVQGLFLARTDYAKILKMIGDDSGIDIDPDGFALALLSTINRFADPSLKLDDDVFPAGYRSAGQQLTGVSIGEWARSVVPTPGKLWGRWQGSDLITKKNFPGTQAQKAELRAFGGFGNKTDPGGKLILEWRNLQTMYADQLVLAMTGLAEYLRQANE